LESVFLKSVVVVVVVAVAAVVAVVAVVAPGWSASNGAR
jgi:hypothetical protein